MVKSLRGQFFIVLLIVSIVAFSLAVVLRQEIVQGFRQHLGRERGESVSWVKAVMESSYERHEGWEKKIAVQDTLWSLMIGVELRLFDAKGNQVMDTVSALNALPPRTRERIATTSGFLATQGEGPFVSYPLMSQGKDIGHLETRFLERPEAEHIFIREVDGFLLIHLLAMAGLAGVLSYWFARKVTKPVEGLAEVARAITEGNLKTRVKIDGNDEMSRLSETFNSMAQNLEKQEALRKKLISDVAHELRTPLSVIRGEIEGMIDGFIPTEREHLQSLYDEIGNLRKILEGIEDLTHAEASALTLKKRPVELKQLLSNIMGDFGKLFREKGITSRLECPEGLAVSVDPDKLSQIIINLLMNALKATDVGGHVAISASRRESSVVIEVADTGCGIREEDLPLIFERFYKVWNGGLGLGLSIVKELVEAHGGKIDVKSEYRKGSIFTVSMPSHS